MFVVGIIAFGDAVSSLRLVSAGLLIAGVVGLKSAEKNPAGIILQKLCNIKLLQDVSWVQTLEKVEAR